MKKILDDIKNRWTEKGLSDLVSKMNNVALGASTGTEGLLMERQFFRDLADQNPEAYTSVKDLIFAYFKECEKYGLQGSPPKL